MATRRTRRLVIWSVVGGSVVLVATQVKGKWGEARPVRTALQKLEERNPDGNKAIAKSLHKFVYEMLSRRLSGPGTSFLNYGYAPLDPPHRDIDLPPELENDRFGMQLYNRVASGAEITDKDVLEVGCGRGGGASFVYERFKPSSMVGLDLAERAVAHCNATHGRDRLDFRAGDAENLPFADGSFDAVLNVESSHCYPDISKFFAEVARVLRPGGYLLMADLRPSENTEDFSAVDELRGQIEAAGLEVVEQEDITRNVVRSLELDTPRRIAAVEDNVPKFLHGQVLDFSGAVGTQTFTNFDTGLAKYTRFAARKP